MKTDELQAIIDIMLKAGLTELCLEEKNLKISLKRHSGAANGACSQDPVVVSQVLSMPTQVAANSAAPMPAVQASKTEENYFVIKSPMVGVFYAASSPDSEPFVHPGSIVKPDTVVCILEAMKVMNEVQAECSGEIVEVCAKNGAPIEYGQPLFKVKV